MIDAGDVRLRAEADQLEGLLDELRELVTPAAWIRIEQILQRVVALYGRGLAHAIEHGRAVSTAAELDERLCGDELLASLLVIHGLHPQPVAARIERALAKAAAALGDDLPTIELAGIADDGIVRLRVAGAFGGGAMSARVAEAAVRRAIEEAAPELAGIEIDGLPPPHDPSLVQIRRSREAPP